MVPGVMRVIHRKNHHFCNLGGYVIDLRLAWTIQERQAEINQSGRDTPESTGTFFYKDGK
jgi:hypothetical protein